MWLTDEETELRVYQLVKVEPGVILKLLRDSISFVICSFVFMQQSKWKLVLDPEEILSQAAYNVTICIHIKFFFTYKSDAKQNWFGEWGRHTKMQQPHTSSSWQRHSFQNISLYWVDNAQESKESQMHTPLTSSFYRPKSY